MKNFLNFNKMITPSIIKIIFYIGVVITVLVGIGMIASGMDSVYGGGFQVFSGMLFILIGPLIIRVYCELLIVMFKMHESLHEINNKLSSNE
ncbi:DUF4282 domain-containing protein [Salimicrobium sp. PL1-032A]|uniref:DUF4282 domain-containing protein n=1 Tax=Salimicrobium sp. PL1-032A TaxID=3095364 RepID=UPI0032617104